MIGEFVAGLLDLGELNREVCEFVAFFEGMEGRIGLAVLSGDGFIGLKKVVELYFRPEVVLSSSSENSLLEEWLYESDYQVSALKSYSRRQRETGLTMLLIAGRSYDPRRCSRRHELGLNLTLLWIRTCVSDIGWGKSSATW